MMEAYHINWNGLHFHNGKLSRRNVFKTKRSSERANHSI